MYRPIIIAIFLYAALALAIGLIFPKYKEFSLVQKKIEEVKTELQYRDNYFNLLGEISQKLNEYPEELSKIDSALPSEPFPLDVFNFIGTASPQNGLALRSVRLGEISSSKVISKVREMKLSFTVTGSFPSFRNFLSVLESSARLIQIENISFNSTGERASMGERAATPFEFKIKIPSY
jgi:Tfp pilus assembly protein PilO